MSKTDELIKLLEHLIGDIDGWEDGRYIELNLDSEDVIEIYNLTKEIKNEKQD